MHVLGNVCRRLRCECEAVSAAMASFWGAFIIILRVLLYVLPYQGTNDCLAYTTVSFFQSKRFRCLIFYLAYVPNVQLVFEPTKQPAGFLVC